LPGKAVSGIRSVTVRLPSIPVPMSVKAFGEYLRAVDFAHSDPYIAANAELELALSL